YVVEIPLGDRQTCMPGLLGDAHDLFQRCIAREGDDVRTWDHHLAHQLVADLDDAVDHLPLFLFDDPLLLRNMQKGHELLLREVGGASSPTASDRTRDQRYEPEDGAEETRQAVHRPSSQ